MPKQFDDLSRLHQLKHQSLRDLAWCCLSAPMMHALPDLPNTLNTRIFPLLESASIIDSDAVWQWLIALDDDPSELDAHLAQRKSTRLGIYYEALWHFYFTHYPDWQLLHYNLQIDTDGSTLGSLDFLCRHREDYFHIETAVKFYLCNAKEQQGASEWNSWIGPGNNDRLDIKLTHLINHQLPMHQFAGTRQVLQARYPEVTQWQSMLCLQGYLFSPAIISSAPFSPASRYLSPTQSHSHHGRGYWWHLSDLLSFLHQPQSFAPKDFRWMILERQRWLSPAHSENPEERYTSTEFASYVEGRMQKINRPLLIAAVKDIGSCERNIWGEFLRGLVVPNQWPDV